MEYLVFDSAVFRRISFNEIVEKTIEEFFFADSKSTIRQTQEYSTRVSARNPMAVSSLARLLTNKRADSGQTDPTYIPWTDLFLYPCHTIFIIGPTLLSSTKRKNHEGTIDAIDGIKYCSEHDTKIESRLERIFFVSFSRLPSPRKFFNVGREN